MEHGDRLVYDRWQLDGSGFHPFGVAYLAHGDARFEQLHDGYRYRRKRFSSVNLSLSGLRKGVSDSFATNPVTATTGGASSILTISASRNAATGTFMITISGSNGSATHGIPLSVTIQ